MAESLTIKINGDIKDFQKKLKGVEASTEELQRALSNIATKATIAFAGLGATITGLIATYRTQEQAERKLETVIRSTGQAAGLTAQELKDMASGLQSVTTFGDEAIIEAQGLLLTFTKVGKDVFPQATESILDMATKLKIDLRSATVMLGKALNDPIAGINAMARSGVQFTEVQKKMVKAQVEMGNVSKAQTIILKELQTQFGGQARAAAEGTGRFDQLANTLGDLGEKIGKHLVPPLATMADKFNKILEDILKKKGDEFGKTAASILLIATNASILTAGLALATKGLIATRVAVQALGLSFKGLRAAIISSGVGIVIVGLSVIIEKFVSNFDSNMELAKKIWGQFTKFVNLSVNLIKERFETTIEIIRALKGAIVSIGQDALTFFKKIKDGLVGFFKEGTKTVEDNWFTKIKHQNKKSNDDILKEQASFAETFVTNTKNMLGDVIEITNQHNEEKKRIREEEREKIREQKQTEKEEEEARLTMQANRREQQSMTLRKTSIDHEKFIMSAQKRETLEYKKSRDMQDKIDKDNAKRKFENTKESLSTIAGLTSSSNRDLFNVGKAAAIAQAAINAPSAILKAYDTPFPLNFALVPLVTAAVAAQIAQIASASPPKMNDGGMIMGAPGIDQNLAMLSRGELVVPTRNFEEVVGGVAGNRNADIFGDPQTVNVEISFEGDEASQVLTARQIEDRALGISREEVA